MIDSVLNHAAYGPADGCGTFVCLSSYLGEVLLLAVVEFFLLVYVVSRLLKCKPASAHLSTWHSCISWAMTMRQKISATV